MNGLPLKDMEISLEELIDPLAADAGLRLVSVDVERRGKRLVVTVCLDREGGIDVEACAEMSEEISRHLDVEDVISESYNLEVESPGLQRVLRKPREFRCFTGREVDIVLRQAFEGRQKIQGRLKAADDEGITVLADGEEITFPYQALKKTKLHFDAPW
ncbi:MAG: ribosome maturation factor RimP [Actinomycetota bacterium]|nr:ribosome maturation factor RimP [Actinomycetota bacterium]MDD5667131.1 ribosome maturation factor RimP [Actinomycetota bacterium]